MEPIARPSGAPPQSQPHKESSMQPIIFDHVKKIVVQVGTDPESAKKFQELVAAQQRPST